MPRAVRGFTLIELMVVMAIIFILSAIVLTSQNQFNKTLILANTAYDVALALRSVETQGIGSRITNGATNVGYGIHFQSGFPGSFVLFVDGNAPGSSCHPLPANGASAPDAVYGDCAYNAGADTVLQTYTLGNGIKISDFCANGSGGWSCEVANSLTSLDIVFARPNPLPFISVFTGGSGGWSLSYTEACIILSSPQGTSKYILLTSSGEITANAASCSS